MCGPSEVAKCEKHGKLKAQLEELVRIQKTVFGR